LLIGFDANFFAAFMQELTSGTPETAVQAETKAEGMGSIAADSQGLVLQEWKDATGAHAREFVEEWISDALRELRIVLFDTTGCHICRRDVLGRGMPKKDAKRLSIYKDVGTDIVISDDIDFFEPTEADCGPRRREKLCLGRSGSLCRHIEKSYGVAIYTHIGFLAETF